MVKNVAYEKVGAPSESAVQGSKQDSDNPLPFGVQMSVQADIAMLEAALREPYEIRGDGQIDRGMVLNAQDALVRVMEAVASHAKLVGRLQRELMTQAYEWNDEMAMLGQGAAKDAGRITELERRLAWWRDNYGVISEAVDEVLTEWGREGG